MLSLCSCVKLLESSVTVLLKACCSCYVGLKVTRQWKYCMRHSLFRTTHLIMLESDKLFLCSVSLRGLHFAAVLVNILPRCVLRRHSLSLCTCHQAEATLWSDPEQPRISFQTWWSKAKLDIPCEECKREIFTLFWSCCTSLHPLTVRWQRKKK